MNLNLGLNSLTLFSALFYLASAVHLFLLKVCFSFLFYYIHFSEPLSLPSQFGHLTELRVLDVSCNSLSIVPSYLFACWPKLRVLHLEDNSITCISPEIRQLGSLQELYLQNNMLESLSAEIARLKELKVLNLKNNRIAALPPQIALLKKLQTFGVGDQNNQLRTPPREVVQLGTAHIISFLTQLLQGQQPCFRMKVMFVGQENVG